MLASYWTLRRAREGEAETLVRQALQLSLTPRTEVQRGELAERAAVAAEGLQGKWSCGEIRAAVVVNVASLQVQREVRVRLRAGLRALFAYVNHKNRTSNAAAALLTRTISQKLTQQRSAVYQSLASLLLQHRWGQLERNTTLFTTQMAAIIQQISKKKLKSAWETIKKRGNTAKARKLWEIGTRRNERQIWIAFQLISKEIKGENVPKCDGSLKICRVLGKFIADRVKFARIRLWKVIACKRLCNFLSFKRSMRLQKALNRFYTRPSALNRYISYAIRGLQTLFALYKPFISLITTGLLTYRNLLQSPYLRLQLSLCLQIPADKLQPKVQKFRLYHKYRAFAAIRAGGSGNRHCGKLLQALGRAWKGSQVGGKLAAMRVFWRLIVEKQGKRAIEEKIVTLGSEKEAAKQRKRERFEALLQLKQVQIASNKGKQSSFLKGISSSALSLVLTRALRARFHSAQRGALAPAPVHTSKRFQHLLRRPLRLKLKFLLSSMRTIKRIKAKAAGRVKGLVTVLEGKRGKLQARGLFCLYRYGWNTSNYSRNRHANQQLSIQSVSKVIGKCIIKRLFKATAKLQLCTLQPQRFLQKILPIVRINRLRALRWIRINAKLSRIEGIICKNRYLMVKKAVSAIKLQEFMATNRVNWRKFAAKRLENALKHSVKSTFSGIMTIARYKKAGERLIAVFWPIIIRLKAKITDNLLCICKNQAKDQKLALNRLFPISDRLRKRTSLLNWQEKGVKLLQMGVLMDKFVSKLNRVIKAGKLVRFTFAFARILAKSENRKVLPYRMSGLIARKLVKAKAVAWSSLRCSRKVLATASVQQLGGALHIAKKIERLRSRFQRISKGHVFRLFKHISAKRRAAKRLFSGLKRYLLAIQRGNMESIRTTEIGLERQKRSIYGLCRVLAELPSRAISSNLAFALRALSAEVTRDKRIAIGLKRLLHSSRAGVQRTALLLALTRWKARIPLPLTLPIHLHSALTALSRSASYRLTFQAFECLFTSSLGRDMHYAMLLCRKAAHRADTRRTMRGFG